MRASASLIVTACLIGAAFASDAAAGSYNDAQTALGRGAYADALRLFQDAAATGDPAAGYNLGMMYADGEGTPVDYPKAALWFRKAADEGNPGAQFRLGLLYEHGQGVRRDAATAAGWYLKSATQSYQGAQVRLGLMYSTGEGVPRDEAQAVKWYREAANQGDADGAFGLGLMYAQAAHSPRGTPSQSWFREIMNNVFGAGRWRVTGGYRSPAEENRLRAEGALTVRPGAISRHSMGTPDAPGAYDVVVAGLSPDEAAVRLRHSGTPFRRLFPEGLHGNQGAHLHVEPSDIHVASWSPVPEADDLDRPTEKVTSNAPGANSAEDEAAALVWFRRAAARGSACAKLALGDQTGGKALTARIDMVRRRSGACG